MLKDLRLLLFGSELQTPTDGFTQKTKEEIAHFRRFRLDDAEELSTLIRRTLQTINSRNYGSEIIQEICRYYSPQNLCEISRKKEIHLAIIDKKIKGSVAISKNEISTVFVCHEYQKHGLGKKLMKHAEGIISQNQMTVKLSASITAFAFYQKLGYRLTKQIMTDLGTNYLMEKTLK